MYPHRIPRATGEYRFEAVRFLTTVDDSYLTLPYLPQMLLEVIFELSPIQAPSTEQNVLYHTQPIKTTGFCLAALSLNFGQQFKTLDPVLLGLTDRAPWEFWPVIHVASTA